MTLSSRALLALTFLAFSGLSSNLRAEEKIRVAVASNFAPAAETLAESYRDSGGTPVVLVAGSTGKHYAQIISGAPFQVFLAADELRPTRLAELGLGVPDSRFTYALGRLVLWSPAEDWLDFGERQLRQGMFRRLAIANPRLAPFGLAARQTLESLGLWDSLQGKLVRGENVGQAFHFVSSRNAELGFVSLSQILEVETARIEGAYWIVPAALYKPIRLQALLIKDSPSARDFLEFLRSQQGRAIIEQFGYGLP